MIFKCFDNRASLHNLFQMKPNRCTLILSIFISTALHVSGNYVSIIRRTYGINVKMLFFVLYGWLSGLETRQPPILTYLLNPWCRVLLEKLTGLQLVKKFPAFHYRTHKRPPPVSILGQLNPVHIPTSHLLDNHPNIIHTSTPRSPQWSPSLRFPHQDPIHTLSSPIRATCRAHLILLDFITRTILGEEYKSFSSSLCNLHHYPLPRPS